MTIQVPDFEFLEAKLLHISHTGEKNCFYSSVLFLERHPWLLTSACLSPLYSTLTQQTRSAMSDCSALVFFLQPDMRSFD